MISEAAYVNEIQVLLSEHANEEQATPMKAYMKNHFEFLGIRSPEFKQLLSAFVRDHGIPSVEEAGGVVRRLWQLPEREYQYAAMNLLGRLIKKLGPDAIHLMEHLIITKSWWDTVDYIAPNLVGTLFQRYPELRLPWSEKWIHSDHMWLNRTALLFQLRYKNGTDADLLFQYISKCADSKEFFIRKAIGWALREYSKTEPDAVISFVDRQPLSPLSKREALKVILRNMAISQR